MRVIIGNVRSPANPLLRAVSLVVGVIVLVGALFFGAILLAIGLAVAIVFAAVIAGRLWWIRRKIERAAAGRNAGGPGHAAGSQFGHRPDASSGARIIEGEFTDVSEAQNTARKSDG